MESKNGTIPDTVTSTRIAGGVLVKSKSTQLKRTVSEALIRIQHKNKNPELEIPITIVKTVPAAMLVDSSSSVVPHVITNDTKSRSTICRHKVIGTTKAVLTEDVPATCISLTAEGISKDPLPDATVSSTSEVFPTIKIQTSSMKPTTKLFVNKNKDEKMIKNDKVLTKTRLKDLVKEIDPSESLDEEVEDMLVQLVDDFVTSTVSKSCLLAKHRNSKTLEVEDVQLYLEKTYNMWIPGFGNGLQNIKPIKKTVTASHIQRMALIKKRLKKY